MSLRITDSMLQRSVLRDISLGSERLNITQRQLSSGKEILKPSDDPYATSRALNLRNDLDGVRQHQRNVGESVAWQDVADGAFAGLGSAILRARELLIRGGNDATGPAARAALATEIDQIIGNVKQQANAAYDGRYIFSGTLTNTRPYTDASDIYQGNAGAIFREIGPGVSLQVNQPASQLLGNGQPPPPGGDDGLLHVLRDIADHLRGGTPTDLDALRNTDLTRLEANLDTLNLMRAVNGAGTNRLEAARARLVEVEESVGERLSEVEDADYARTLVTFSTQSAALNAALKSGAQVVQPSLLDFLR